MCNLEFTFGKYHLPEFKLPEGYDSFSYLKKLCDEGYKARYGDDDKYRGQLKYEQDMIEKMGFTDYFLIVSDFVRYAKSVGIPVGPGRGSAAGSMVSYCLSITDIDPMKYSLVLRAVSEPGAGEYAGYRHGLRRYPPGRGGGLRPPQVRRRPCGSDRHLRHHGRPGRDPGRGPGDEHALRRGGPVIAKLVPGNHGALHITLNDALRLSKQLRELYETDPQVKKLIDTAKALEGMPRHASTHAAGVVITETAGV